jgi:hypothetical protein
MKRQKKKGKRTGGLVAPAGARDGPALLWGAGAVTSQVFIKFWNKKYYFICTG